MIFKIILILFSLLVILILLGSKPLSIQDVVQEFLGISPGQDDGGPGGGVVGCKTCKDDCRCNDQQLLSLGDGFFFFHKGWCLVFFFNKVVFTFFQTKELNEVVLGNWFRTGVGGGRPFPSWLLVLDDVGVCHIMSVFEHTYIDTAITPELGFNQ